MEIGKKLKTARANAQMTQEEAAEALDVSRQTISNWENEKSYPDILNVINISKVYAISLDELLLEDEKMIKHLEDTTNVVKSNKKLLGLFALNLIMMVILIAVNSWIGENIPLLIISSSLGVIGTGWLFYMVIMQI
ncbi:MAG: helix-turn-helix transcriptional regulator [Tissierellia bacterium]|nr:helix-turn-helix transcriptional regulator [Tissierellia bacterium]